MVGSEKGCEWWLGETVNKIKISNTKISLINHIDTPPNPTSTNMPAIKDSGESTMEATNISTLQILGLSKLARQIHIYPKMKTSPLI